MQTWYRMWRWVSYNCMNFIRGLFCVIFSLIPLSFFTKFLILSVCGLKVCLRLILFFFLISNGNMTERSPIRSVSKRVINKIGRPRSGSLICLITRMVTDRIGQSIASRATLRRIRRLQARGTQMTKIPALKKGEHIQKNMKIKSIT